MDKVSRLAHRMEQAADRLRRDVEAQAEDFDWRNDQAFRAMLQFTSVAHQFRDRIDDNYDRPWRTEPAFDQLAASYMAAARNLDQFGGRVDRDFRAVRIMMDELENYFGSADDRRPDVHLFPHERGDDLR